ncbi:efflux RND transporter periplasmic adaptor subunit [Chitinimonas arctica]|uniref:Efflux RND transporter periplasmic adaptor subunit n=1 Tax=Chitinimonas arctica TaxID=2594795 RepID=A0A516SBG8_9NEIS|nr:efflux RND transporter periplasmic adaptor subunit [Chitinimonas arctica]QDQ25489.1 efflux RND transporter periplasmic adaptor subunit [Chitinimonas arctica]
MTTQTLKILAAVLATATVGAAGGYWLAQQRMAGPAADLSAVATGAAPERKTLYWYDPMVPDQHFDKGGKSPFMDMQLVPKYADEVGATAGVRIDPGVRQNLGMRLAKVERASMSPTISAVASVQFNERDVAVVQARSGGFVERVYARAPGDVVVAGAPLADVLVPEWAAAQTEFLALANSGDRSLLEAARQRLRLTGMPEGLIALVEKTGRVHAVTPIATPIAGVIQTLEVRMGMTLSAGMTLARVNGLATVWLEAAVPEAQAGQINLAQTVAARFAAYPGEAFKGKVIAILPEANADSRTLRVRVEMSNAKGRFKPGMFAQLQLAAGESTPALIVPSEAVIRTGKRNVVIVALDGNRFQPVEVELGSEVGDKTEIRRGLLAGQQVVASGQFLIDSEASLIGAVARLDGAAAIEGARP